MTPTMPFDIFIALAIGFAAGRLLKATSMTLFPSERTASSSVDIDVTHRRLIARELRRVTEDDAIDERLRRQLQRRLISMAREIGDEL